MEPHEKKSADLSAKVDELGSLEKEFAPHAFKARRIEELRKAIRESFASADADQPIEVRGKRFTVLLGPRAAERRVNVKALARRIGAKAFAMIATVSLTALEASVGAEDIGDFVETTRTGSRTMKILEMGGNA